MVHTYSYGKLNLSDYDAYKGANICRKCFSQARFDTCTMHIVEVRYEIGIGMSFSLRRAPEQGISKGEASQGRALPMCQL